MNPKDKILDYLKTKKTATGKELCDLLGISRQALHKHVKKLINNSLVLKNGSTRNTKYTYLPPSKKNMLKKMIYKKELSLKGLEEDKIFNELSLLSNLRKSVSPKSYAILQYAFTEILNNAIDHSNSQKCNIELTWDQYNIQFIIRDFGIGVFYSIYKKFKLSDENSAIAELIKGKTTTMKERHSGEGIFFTSKAADIMSLRSHKINLIFDNKNGDTLLEEKRAIIGTEVKFSISKNTKKNLTDIFASFSPEEFDYQFEKTKVAIKIFQQSYISRSEAKRLLFGLDKFKVIVLDFKGVKSIGQGFADEIFRVFQNNHPKIKIKAENVSEVLNIMLQRYTDHQQTENQNE